MCCHSKSKAEDHATYVDSIFLNQPKDKESMLDFTLNQSEIQQQLEDNVFRGFCDEDCEGHSHSGSEKSKICLPDQTPVNSSAPQ